MCCGQFGLGQTGVEFIMANLVSWHPLAAVTVFQTRDQVKAALAGSG